jgi:hypothetical protein
LFIAIAVIAIAFMNTPLPTTLVSGGMALLAMLMYLAPRISERGHRVISSTDGLH